MYWEETRLGTHEVVLVRDLLWKFMFEIFDFLYQNLYRKLRAGILK